jgi:hypothetical protein
MLNLEGSEHPMFTVTEHPAEGVSQRAVSIRTRLCARRELLVFRLKPTKVPRLNVKNVTTPSHSVRKHTLGEAHASFSLCCWHLLTYLSSYALASIAYA